MEIINNQKYVMVFEIDGSTYTEEELIDVLREQLPGLKKYSQYENGTIEFCRQNKDGDLFFSVTPDDMDEEEMFVKIGQDGNIYWDWTGPIMDV